MNGSQHQALSTVPVSCVPYEVAHRRHESSICQGLDGTQCIPAADSAGFHKQQEGCYFISCETSKVEPVILWIPVYQSIPLQVCFQKVSCRKDSGILVSLKITETCKNMFSF